MQIVILGAGSIGCYVGGRLAAVGAKVAFIGRPRMQAILQDKGLNLTHFNQSQVRVRAEQFEFSTDADRLAEADVVILTVKSQDTAAAAKQMKDKLKSRATVISLQNGVGNVACLQSTLSNIKVVGGMVPFNVTNQGQGRFHCGTEGVLSMQSANLHSNLLTYFNKAGLPVKQCKDIEAVQWGKLLMNLNNALNVLSDQPLQQQLSDRNYRRVLAQCIAEALRCMDRAKIKPVRVGKLMPRLLPFALRLPDRVFHVLAKGMLKMDPQARSSMWEDLQAKRAPEIDYLNGAIVRLGKKTDMATPVNQKIVVLVGEAFRAGASPAYTGDQLLRII